MESEKGKDVKHEDIRLLESRRAQGVVVDLVGPQNDTFIIYW